MARIETIETFIVDLPTVRQHVLSMATMTMQTIMLVRVRDTDGAHGWGEGTTIGGLSYGEESVEGMKLTVDTYLAPALIGHDASNVSAACATMDGIAKGNLSAKCAVETALQDLRARRLGVSLAVLLGGAVRERVECAWTLASGDAARDADEAVDMLERCRHRIFKIKIGQRPLAADVSHVAAVKRAVGDAASVRTDVNQAWTPHEARRGVAMLADVGCDLVEQPIHRRHLADLAALTANAPLAIMADEALRGPHDGAAVAAARGADVFSVKIAQSGGIGPAARVAGIAEAAGIGLYGGTMIESGVATAAAAQLFATLPTLAFGSELFGPLLFTEELLTEPLAYADFALTVPTGPGLGVEVDGERLDALRRDRTRTLHAVPAAAAGA